MKFSRRVRHDLIFLPSCIPSCLQIFVTNLTKTIRQNSVKLAFLNIFPPFSHQKQSITLFVSCSRLVLFKPRHSALSIGFFCHSIWDNFRQNFWPSSDWFHLEKIKWPPNMSFLMNKCCLFYFVTNFCLILVKKWPNNSFFSNQIFFAFFRPKCLLKKFILREKFTNFSPNWFFLNPNKSLTSI